MTLAQEQTIDQLVEEYQGLVRYIAGRFWAPGYDRDDMIAEANIGLLKAIRTFKPEDGREFLPYAGTVIRRHIYKVIRKARAEKRAADADTLYLHAPLPSGDEADGLHIDWVEGSEFSPEDMLLSSSLKKRVLELIEEPGVLNNGDRDAFRLSVQGFSIKEIAESLNISRTAANQRRTRARDALRMQLKAEGLIDMQTHKTAEKSSLAGWIRKAAANGVPENKFRARLAIGWEPERAALPEGSLLRKRFTEEDRQLVREKLLEGLNGGEIFEAYFTGSRSRQSAINFVARIRRDMRKEGLL